jgi:hypothetical protein
MANIVAKAASFNPENHLILANPGSDCGECNLKTKTAP